MKTIEFPFSSCQLKDSILIPLNYLLEAGIWYLGYWLISLWQETGEPTIGWLFWVGVFLFVRAVFGMSAYGGGREEELKSAKRYNAHLYYPAITLWRTFITICYLIEQIPIRFRYKYND